MTFRSTDATRYNKSDFLEEVYMDEASYDAIVSRCLREKRISFSRVRRVRGKPLLLHDWHIRSWALPIIRV